MTTTPDLSTEAAPAKTDDNGANDLGRARRIDLDKLQARRSAFDGQLSTGDIDKLFAAIEALRDEVAGYDTLLDLAQKRERPWIEAWRKASGKPDTLPDYGEMLAWLCGRIEAAEARVKELEVLVKDGVRRGLNCMGWQSRAGAAEAREVVLARALEEIGSGPCCGTESCCEDDPKCDAMMARAALATTRPQALERARAVEVVVTAAREGLVDARNEIVSQSTERGPSWNWLLGIDNALSTLAKLNALDEEGT